jgi:hypothetical protein
MMFRGRIAIGLTLFVLVCTGVILLSTESASGLDWSQLSVSTSEGKITFFDTSSGRVYVYGIGSGKVLYQWQLDELGKDLKDIKGEQTSLFERNLMSR